jgi:hypothetical protein
MGRVSTATGRDGTSRARGAAKTEATRGRARKMESESHFGGCFGVVGGVK